MRISILMASLAVALMTITTARSAPSADPARVLRSITPWAPPEWHPNREALDVPSGFEGHAEKRVPGLDSRAAFVYDVDADQVLFDRRADDPYPIASLTKLVSSLAMASEHPDLDKVVCVNDEFRPTRSGARSRLSKGECYTGWDLLGAALVSSDNRAAYGLQVVSGLEFDEFVGRMDDVAADLGMTRSSFAEPSGLEDDNFSSARDIVRATLAVAAHPELSVAASAPFWQLQPQDHGRVRLLHSTDRIAGNKRYDVLAAKTGFSNTAGYCFTTVVRTPSGRKLAISLLGAGSTGRRWSDLTRILATFGG